VALSYVWGNPLANTQNGPLHGDINLQFLSLPNVVQDAIKITDLLGFRYLWVDRYCISQINKEERHSQIRNMDSIYAVAELTLVAAAGNNPSFGLPGVDSSRPRRSQDVFHLDGMTYISIPQDAKLLIQQSTWAQRAWTYQEALLSRRRLVFTEYQVYFECREMHCSETIDASLESLCNRTGSSTVWDKIRVFPQNGVGQYGSDIWQRISEYSARSPNLTREEDILNGILGIFRSFERLQSPVFHYFGVPVVQDIPNEGRFPNQKPNPVILKTTHLENFINGLCWTLEEPGKRRNKDETFPSWSWIGWFGRADWAFGGSTVMKNTHSINIDIELSDGTSLGIDQYFTSYYHSISSSRLTPYLQVEAETCDIRFQYLELRYGNNSGSSWWMEMSGDPARQIFVKLQLTARIDNNSELSKRLLRDNWHGIVLGQKCKTAIFEWDARLNVGLFILVVDDTLAVATRVGYIDCSSLVERVPDPCQHYVLETPNGPHRLEKVIGLEYEDIQKQCLKLRTKRQVFRLG